MFAIMKICFNILMFAVCVACFFGCKEVAKVSAEAIIVTCDNYEPRPIETADYFSEVKIVPLEETENCILEYVRQAELRDSLLFVSDGDNLCVFDLDGRFVSKIGRKGRGPGEYMGMIGFVVDTDDRTVAVLDHVAEHIARYGYDGEYISSEHIPGALGIGRTAVLAGDGKVLVNNVFYPSNNALYALVDPAHPDRTEDFYDYEPIKADGSFFTAHPMTRSGEGVLFTVPCENAVYEYSDGRFSQKYHIEIPKEIVPKEALTDNSPYLSQIVDQVDNGYFGGFTDIFDTDNLIFIHYWDKMAYPGVYVLDKKSNTGEYLSYPYGQELLKRPVFPFSASDGDMMVGLVSSVPLMSLRHTATDAADGEIHDGLRAALDDMADSGNPLMVVYELKK